MSLAGKNVTFTDAVVLGLTSPTAKLNSLPTLVVSKSSADPLVQTVSLAGFQVVNFISGVNAVLQSTTLVKNCVYLFVNTGAGTVSLTLDNGGTINGSASAYILTAGAAIEFLFDGTNLS